MPATIKTNYLVFFVTKLVTTNIDILLVKQKTSIDFYLKYTKTNKISLCRNSTAEYFAYLKLLYTFVDVLQN